MQMFRSVLYKNAVIDMTGWVFEQNVTALSSDFQ